MVWDTPCYVVMVWQPWGGRGDAAQRQDLSLPQIVVVGGQSSGKSSLLTELIHLSRVVVPPWQIPKGYASDLLLQHPAARDARRLNKPEMMGCRAWARILSTSCCHEADFFSGRRLGHLRKRTSQR